MNAFTIDGKNYEMKQYTYDDIVTKILPNLFGVSLTSNVTYEELYIIGEMLNGGWSLMPCFSEDEELKTIYPIYNKFSKWCNDGNHTPVLYVCSIDYTYNEVTLYSNGNLVGKFQSFDLFRNHMNSIFEQPPAKCKKYFDIEIISNVRRFERTGFDEIYHRDSEVYHNEMRSDCEFTYEIDTDKCSEIINNEGEE